jgi:hypothetical protein
MAEQTVPIDVNALLKEMDELKKDKANLECKLDKIIHHESKQKYYEKNKEQIMKKSSQWLKKTKEENPEKIKEYRRRAYLKMKEKKKLEQESFQRGHPETFGVTH